MTLHSRYFAWHFNHQYFGSIILIFYIFAWHFNQQHFYMVKVIFHGIYRYYFAWLFNQYYSDGIYPLLLLHGSLTLLFCMLIWTLLFCFFYLIVIVVIGDHVNFVGLQPISTLFLSWSFNSMSFYVGFQPILILFFCHSCYIPCYRMQVFSQYQLYFLIVVV